MATKLLLAVTLILCGCSAISKPPSLKGGQLYASIPQKPLTEAFQTPRNDFSTSPLPTVAPVVVKLSQGQNQSEPSTASYTRETAPDGTVKESLETRMGTHQLDPAREDWGSLAKFEAKLKSYGSIKVFGFVLVALALGMFYPPVRAFTGSTVQIACGATGLGLIFGSQLIAGNETMVLLLAAGGLAALYFFRRHGYLQGMVDANKNGIPDNLEGKA